MPVELYQPVSRFHPFWIEHNGFDLLRCFVQSGFLYILLESFFQPITFRMYVDSKNQSIFVQIV